MIRVLPALMLAGGVYALLAGAIAAAVVLLVGVPVSALVALGERVPS
jgi:hypothetical protein